MKNLFLNLLLFIVVTGLAVIGLMSNKEIDEATFIYRQMALQEEEK